MKELLPKLLFALALLGGVAVAFVQSEKYLKIRAVDDCMNAATFTYVDSAKGITTVEPMKDQYETCIKTKGY